ncbi:MAG: twin-arginine translocase subunit TatC [Saprospiraceae bacterium]
MALDQQHEVERLKTQRGEMTFFDHISELRRHLLRSVLAVSIFAIYFLSDKEFVFNTLMFGPRDPNFPTYRAICRFSNWVGAGDKMCFTPPKFDVITRELGEALMSHMYISFCMGAICAFPYIFWEFWRFVRPGLLESERKAASGVVVTCSLLFMLGNLFGYFVIAPFSISFLASYTVEGLNISPTLDSYVSYMTMFTLPTGLIFEMPIVAYFLTKIGILGPKDLRQYRRHAVVAIVVIAVVITPPDVMSQTIVSLPLFALYEISILVAAREKRRRDKALDAKERENRQVVAVKDEEE